MKSELSNTSCKLIWWDRFWVAIDHVSEVTAYYKITHKSGRGGF